MKNSPIKKPRKLVPFNPNDKEQCESFGRALIEFLKKDKGPPRFLTMNKKTYGKIIKEFTGAEKIGWKKSGEIRQIQQGAI